MRTERSRGAPLEGRSADPDLAKSETSVGSQENSSDMQILDVVKK